MHYIYDNNVLVGQIGREYLFRNGKSIDIHAIVVYPIGQGGKMDLTRGYVAQVYNRARNSSTNQYEINPGTVHGGFVEFGPKDTLYTYTAGRLAPVSKVVVNGASDITAAAGNAITTLDVRPYLMTDADGTSYPVVKIGTQYWMQQNLKAEHYIDGTPITVYYFNDDRTTNRDVLGGLYTWHSINTAPGVAPDGWRIPTYDDWYSIYHYLYPDAGRKMRALEMWANMSNADNVSGFSGLPAGRRTDSGSYNERNSYGQWWSSYSPTTSDGWRIYLSSGGASISTGNLGKNYTQSIRLLRDN